jgi:hypothetical protein
VSGNNVINGNIGVGQVQAHMAWDCSRLTSRVRESRTALADVRAAIATVEESVIVCIVDQNGGTGISQNATSR